MSDRSVTLNRACFSAAVDQVVPCLISPRKANMGLAVVMGWDVGGTALLPEPQDQAGPRGSSFPPHAPESLLGRNHSDLNKR